MTQICLEPEQPWNSPFHAVQAAIMLWELVNWIDRCVSGTLVNMSVMRRKCLTIIIQLWGAMSAGQSHINWLRKCRPWNQLECIFSTSHPREKLSAGFCLPSIWCNWPELECCRTSDTLFATKTLKRLDSFCMYARAMALSVKKEERTIWISNSLLRSTLPRLQHTIQVEG